MRTRNSERYVTGTPVKACTSRPSTFTERPRIGPELVCTTNRSIIPYAGVNRCITGSINETSGANRIIMTPNYQIQPRTHTHTSSVRGGGGGKIVMRRDDQVDVERACEPQITHTSTARQIDRRTGSVRVFGFDMFRLMFVHVV